MTPQAFPHSVEAEHAPRSARFLKPNGISRIWTPVLPEVPMCVPVRCQFFCSKTGDVSKSNPKPKEHHLNEVLAAILKR